MKYPMHLTVGFALDVAMGIGPVKASELFRDGTPIVEIIATLKKCRPDALMPCGHDDCAYASEHAILGIEVPFAFDPFRDRKPR